MKAAAKFVEDPNVTVVVKEINSRKVFITGQVDKPGPYPLTATMTVLQLIAHGRRAARVRRREEHRRSCAPRTASERRFTFNYKDVVKRQERSSRTSS